MSVCAEVVAWLELAVFLF